MPRIVCLLVPLFPLAARLRSEPDLTGEAVAVCEGNGSAAHVVAASRIARRAGVTSGMSLAQARSILPSLTARGRDTACERSAHEALLEVAWSLSPQVEIATPARLFVDVSGMEFLFPGASGEQELGQAAVRTAESLSLPMRVGLASTKLAAGVAARLPESPTVVPRGGEAAFLAPLPIGHLGLDHRLTEILDRWGVNTVGDLARLPADRVASRLGPQGAWAHRAARGQDSRPISPHRPQMTLTEGLELEWPAMTVEPLLYAVRQCLERSIGRLVHLDLACVTLELDLTLEPEGVDRRTIRLPSPTRDLEALLTLVRLEVEARPPHSPVAGFSCVIHPDQPRRGQLALFGPAEIHPDTLATVLARLMGRLGPEAVGSPRTVDGHAPERAGSEVFQPPAAPTICQEVRQGRGLLAVRVLRPPVDLEVITEEPKTGNHSNLPRLMSIASVQGATPRIQGLVRVAAGPWSLEEGWWRDKPIVREYWDVELSGGGLYRIYHDRTNGDWYADGIYD